MGAIDVVREWVARFNRADIEGLAALYAEDAVNHQVVMAPLHGRAAIRRMFEVEFGRATMVCVVENLLDAGDWACLEWSDPKGASGQFPVPAPEVVRLASKARVAGHGGSMSKTRNAAGRPHNPGPEGCFCAPPHLRWAP